MKLPKFLMLNKEIGETPLEVLETFKKENHLYAAVRMSYAGRLDPLASGQLLVLVGEECKKQQKYIGLDKEYEFEVLVGMKTDTQDVLGVAEFGEVQPAAAPDEQQIKQAVSKLSGKRTISYPAFSSKTVSGKPLFKWALEGRLDEIELPTKDIQIFSLNYVDSKKVSSKELFTQISDKIESIKPVTEHQKALGNDFRRPEIRVRYTELAEQVEEGQDFYILKFRCICTSGTYMRTLAQDLAEELGYYGLAFSIHRTKMGRHMKLGPFGFWFKKFR